MTVGWKNIVLLFLLLLFQVDLSAWSESKHPHPVQASSFKQISVHDGLSRNWVRCIYQDSLDFMWFGTSGGLDRFDGNDFVTYNLGNVNINGIARKNDYELWIACDLGLFIYNQERDTLYSFDHSEDLTVMAVLQEPDNTVWLGTSTGLYRYDPGNDTIFRYSVDDGTKSGLRSNFINALFLDSSGRLWIGTKSGLVRYIKSTDSFKSYQALGEPGDISGNDIRNICEDHLHRIWIGTSKDGVDLLLEDNHEQVSFKKIIDGSIVSLMVDRYNHLWIARSSGGGLLVVDLDHFSLEESPEILYFLNNPLDPGSLSDNSVFCIYEDRFGDIWIGTFGGGLNYFSYRSKQFYSVKKGINEIPSLENNLVNAIWEEARYLWIGTEGGLDRFDKTNNTTLHFQYESSDPSSLSSNPVYTLYRDGRDNFWVGTWAGGLNLFNYQALSFVRFLPGDKSGFTFSENVFAILEDSRENLWVGTVGGGLNRYDYKTGIFTSYQHDPDDPKSLYRDNIEDILETHDGRLLISSYGSLDIFNYDEDEFSHYPLDSIFTGRESSAFVTCIFEDSRYQTWLGTNKGLILYNEEANNARVYTIQDGLAGNSVYAILEDDHGNLWLGTNSGLSKFIQAIDCPDRAEFQTFYEDDGLSGNEFKRRAAFKNKSGLMYFGTSQGYSYFHPDSISLNEIPPEIAFVEMQLLQLRSTDNPDNRFLVKGINSIDQLELAYNKSDFVIKFAALNYLNPAKNRYKHMLEGYDPDWITDNQRTATYKNLESGRYTFKVMGTNNDGTWSTYEKTLEIMIPPPFWKTWFFRIAIVLLLVLITFLAFNLRVKAIEQDRRRLEALVRERTLNLEQSNDELKATLHDLKEKQFQLIQAEKMSSLGTLTAGVAHEINNPLNFISGACIGLNAYFDEFGSKDERTTALMLTSIQEGIDRASTIVRGLSQFSRESDRLNEDCDIHLILNNCLAMVNNQIEPHVKIIKEYFREIIILPGNVGKLHQVFINILVNSIQAIQNDGEIRISTRRNDLTSVIEISDNGSGIDKKYLPQVTDPFYTTKPPGQGTGLGLSIAYTIIKEHRGSMRIESEIDKGTRVILEIPNEI